MPLIASSARKHGITDEDVTHAFHNPVLVDDLDEGFTMFIGGERSGNLLEVGVIDGEDGPVIIHAMPARPLYLRWKTCHEQPKRSLIKPTNSPPDSSITSRT